jgi:hypothetical protein
MGDVLPDWVIVLGAIVLLAGLVAFLVAEARASRKKGPDDRP